MLEAINLPTRAANLNAALSNVERYDFSVTIGWHISFCVDTRKSPVPSHACVILLWFSGIDSSCIYLRCRHGKDEFNGIFKTIDPAKFTDDERKYEQLTDKLLVSLELNIFTEILRIRFKV
jgi:hypothetical protein